MSKIKRAFLLQLAGSILLVGLVVFLGHYFRLDHVIVHMQKRIDEMHAWGGVLYVPLYATCNVLLLPGSVLTVGSGLCFGLWWGFLLTLMGNVLGAAIAFGISRKLGREWVEKKFLKYPKWRALDEAVTREGWKIIFLSQVHPLFPTSLLNYMYGITRIRFWPCMLWIAIGQTPGLFLYVYLGTLAQLGIKVVRGENHPQPIEYVVWISGLLVALAVAAALGRIALKLMAEVGQAAEKQAADGTQKSPDLEKSLF
ncbi:MAG TPA: TVP38/TMEM64 family protein [Chthoniobacteraceae bacterium]|nr:TVP38/TMEM64 family protein [Chthoniobacteraceae bacterium]